MKVFIVIDHWFPNIGGGPKHVYAIAQNLAARHNVDVEIVTSKLLANDTLSLKSENNKSYIKVTQLGPAGKFNRFQDRVFFLFNLFIHLVRCDYDILHVHPYFPLIIAKLVALIKNVPVVVTIHTLGVDPVGLKFFAKWLQKIDYILTFSIPYDAQIFVDRNLSKKPSSTKLRYYVPNGIEIDNFNRVKVKKNKIFQIIFVGRLHPQKNLYSLLQAYKLFLKKIKINCNLLLVGDGEQKRHLEKMVRDLSLSSNISFYGPAWDDDLIRFYKKSHVFILPSKYEGFPLTILEAWAAKLPVVATPVGENKYLIKDGYNGFLTRDSSVKSIEKTLLRAYHFGNLSHLGMNGFKMVRHGYSWKKVADLTYRIYKTVLDKEN